MKFDLLKKVGTLALAATAVASMSVSHAGAKKVRRKLPSAFGTNVTVVAQWAVQRRELQSHLRDPCPQRGAAARRNGVVRAAGPPRLRLEPGRACACLP